MEHGNEVQESIELKQEKDFREFTKNGGSGILLAAPGSLIDFPGEQGDL